MVKRKKDEVFDQLKAELEKVVRGDTYNVSTVTGQAIGMVQALLACGFLDNKESADWLLKFFDIV